jgi:hypothetical protein
MITRHGNSHEYFSDWHTPESILKLVKDVFDGTIDLDVCSDAKAQETVNATKYFTAEDNGLLQPWNARRIWCNFPGGRGESTRWFQKAQQQFQNNTTIEAIMMCIFSIEALPLNPEMFDHTLVFLRKRIPFVRWNEKNEVCVSKPTHSSALLLMSKSIHIADTFEEVMQNHGTVVECRRLS